MNNTTRVKISKSLKVIGKFILEHDDGTEELINGKRSFCRCGFSKTMPFCDNSHRTITENTSGEYFDAQRKRQIEAMQNKNTLLHKEWREDFDKRQMDKKEKSKANYIDENTQLFWWESIDHN